ncbi:MAG: hypothetical protein IJC43_04195 [Clostridia bacterium]|nr:hypothetical protein [Clostridia bacterium]
MNIKAEQDGQEYELEECSLEITVSKKTLLTLAAGAALLWAVVQLWKKD